MGEAACGRHISEVTGAAGGNFYLFEVDYGMPSGREDRGSLYQLPDSILQVVAGFSKDGYKAGK
jgi:hypothetical protein